MEGMEDILLNNIKIVVGIMEIVEIVWEYERGCPVNIV
jgi:hypothetical protein